MTEAPRDEPAKFARKARETPFARSTNDRENVLSELNEVQARIGRVAASDQSDFFNGAVLYDVASIAMQRVYGLLEVPANSYLLGVLTDEEFAGIRTIRNITAHAGYKSMNDAAFWIAVTDRLPVIVAKLRRVVEDAET